MKLKPGRERPLREGRPWVYRTEVLTVDGAPAAGDVVDVTDARGRFVARGIVNPRSMLYVRLFTRERDEPVDASLVRRRLEGAWAYRRWALADTTACRVVFAEADGLPGLIVDRFGDVAVVQFLAVAAEVFREAVAAALLELLPVHALYERSDAPVRDLEGLERRTGWLTGQGQTLLTIPENGLLFRVDIARGQKTGHFLDQRFNRAALAHLVRGARVLDAFCHTGGFALHAAAYGAAEVIGVDISADALALAAENAALNGLAERIRWRTANAFDLLRELDAARERFDVVILDPPAFARSRAALAGAYRGYKEINLRALRLLRPGGFLVTSSCSSPVDEPWFETMLRDAAADARHLLRIVRRSGAGPDHPILLGADETRYLKHYQLQV
ncbi:MAG: class I SAM-dependent rRNA methyltransferase, partial [Clostridia bacterium]|nr:class I SAM-dependent rRNA methyltransferase [Clostridia bacterium]